MGGCVRKPTPVYKYILIECFDLLNQKKGEGPEKPVDYKKLFQKMNNQILIQREQQNIQILPSPQKEKEKEQAALSFQKFSQRSDIDQLQSQVKQQAKVLTDHLTDTQNRLIDTIQYLRQIIITWCQNYGIQWVSLLVIEEILLNMNKYKITINNEQRKNKFLFNQMNPASNQGNNDVGFNLSKVDSQIGGQNCQQFNISQPVFGKRSFLNKQFQWFENELIEIAIFIFNPSLNYFYSESEIKFLKILSLFTFNHEDHVSSQNAIFLFQFLEVNIQEQIDSITNQTEEINKSIFDRLVCYISTYQLTYAKVLIEKSFLISEEQEQFMKYILKAITNLKQLLNNTNIQLNSKFIKKNQNQIELISDIRVHLSNIILGFARKSFMLFEHCKFIRILLQHFDEFKWHDLEMIKEIISNSSAIAQLQSLTLDYEVQLLDKLISYLFLNQNKSLSEINNTSNYRKIITNDQFNAQVQVCNSKKKKYKNFHLPEVWIQVLQIFNFIIGSMVNRLPAFQHVILKIIKTYIYFFKETEAQNLNGLKFSLASTFCSLSDQICSQNITLLEILQIISEQICNWIFEQKYIKKKINRIESNQNINFEEFQISVLRQEKLEYENLEFYTYQGIQLMLLLIKQGKIKNSPVTLNQEIIENLLFISEKNKLSVITFQILKQLLNFFILPKKPKNSNSKINDKILLQIFEMSIKCILKSSPQEQIRYSIVIYQSIIQIAQIIIKKMDWKNINLIIIFVIKLLKEISIFHPNKSAQKENYINLLTQKENLNENYFFEYQIPKPLMNITICFTSQMIDHLSLISIELKKDNLICKNLTQVLNFCQEIRNYEEILSSYPIISPSQLITQNKIIEKQNQTMNQLCEVQLIEISDRNYKKLIRDLEVIAENGSVFKQQFEKTQSFGIKQMNQIMKQIQFNDPFSVEKYSQDSFSNNQFNNTPENKGQQHFYEVNDGKFEKILKIIQRKVYPNSFMLV